MDWQFEMESQITGHPSSWLSLVLRPCWVPEDSLLHGHV